MNLLLTSESQYQNSLDPLPKIAALLVSQLKRQLQYLYQLKTVLAVERQFNLVHVTRKPSNCINFATQSTHNLIMASIKSDCGFSALDSVQCYTILAVNLMTDTKLIVTAVN